MAIYLTASLSGCAQAVLTDLDKNPRRNYQALREALLLWFGNSGKTEVFRSQLKNPARGKDKSLPELAQVIQRLVMQAAPSVRAVLERTTLSMQLQIRTSAGKYSKLDLE